MRVVLQRVRSASVEVAGETVGSCGPGFLVLLGVAPSDTPADAERLWHKVVHLRVFDDDQGKMNRSIVDVDGEVLVVSQFTLYANVRRGNRPSFVGAAQPEVAIPLYERFCALAEADLHHVGKGVFGANMQVSLVNDGPVTVIIDTDDLSTSRRGADRPSKSS